MPGSPSSAVTGSVESGPTQPSIKVSEEGDCRFEVADGDSDVLEFDGHALQAIQGVWVTGSGALPLLPGGSLCRARVPRHQRLARQMLDE